MCKLPQEPGARSNGRVGIRAEEEEKAMRWVSIINQARGRSGRARAGGIALCVAAVVGAGTLATCGSSDDNGNTSTGASTGAAAASTPAETTSGSTSTPAAAESAGV